MNEHVLYVLYISLTGMVATGIGGALSSILPSKSKRFLCSVLEFSAGLMLSVVFFDLLPNALEQSNITNVALGILVGIFFMIITESLTKTSSNSMIKIGTVMAIGIALHNFPEGLALGVAMDFDTALAMSLMFAIFAHDIPEGLAFAVPLKMGGMKAMKIFYISLITGLSTGVGGLFGVTLGEVSENVIGFSLALASGAMLYIILNDIVPKSKTMYKGKMPFLCNVLGIILGMLIAKI